MDDLLRGLALVAKGLGDSAARASYSLGLGALLFGCTLLLLDQGLIIVSEPARWLLGVGTLSLGSGLGRRFDFQRRYALPSPSAHPDGTRALLAGTTDAGQHKPTIEQVSRSLALELAKVTHDEESAKTLARRAGFPPEHLPTFKTAIAFWSDIVEQTIGGRGNLRALVDEAIEQFPYNPAFRRHGNAIHEILAPAESCMSHTANAAGSISEREP